MLKTYKHELIALAGGTAFCLLAALAFTASTSLSAHSPYGGDCTFNVPLMSSMTIDIRC